MSRVARLLGRSRCGMWWLVTGSTRLRRWTGPNCHERQIALVYDEDGSLTPWAGAHTKPGATTQETSNGRADGQQPGGAEEMTAPDHQTD